MSGKGYYAAYAGGKYTLPSGQSKQIDHQLPNSITPGSYSSKFAVPMHKDQHRRKNTTGSSHWSQHQRTYLDKGQQGFIPFAGPMETPQDHLAASTSIDIQGSFTPRTLFAEHGGEPMEPGIPPKSQQVTQRKDAFATLNETENMVKRMHSQKVINDSGRDMLMDTVTNQRSEVTDMYKARGYTS